MEGIKIAVIGAGSSYTPEIMEGLVQGDLPVSEIALMDIDPARLEVMRGFLGRFLNHLGKTSVRLSATTDRREAIRGARFVVVQIRVGGNQQRVRDEKIPMTFGLIGQETTGAGGMMKAFRTIPVMVELAKEIEETNPEAWIINYTNPTGLVTEAVNRCTQAKIAGLCSGGLFPAWTTAKALGVPAESVQYDYVGLNHLNFAYNFTVHGRPVSEEEFDRIAQTAARGSIDYDLIKALKLVPSPYLGYFYHTGRKIEATRKAGKTRGEEVLELEKDVFEAYADPNQAAKPEALKRRGGGGYSQVALAVMKAIYTNREDRIIVNVPNRGAVDCLPEDAVVEIPCRVDASGISGERMGKMPAGVWGLISAVKNYEQLAVRAALSGSREEALLALLAHPLVRDADTAHPLLDEMLEANREYLPQFFKEERA